MTRQVANPNEINQLVKNLKRNARNYQGDPSSLVELHGRLFNPDERRIIVDRLAEETGYPKALIDNICFAPFSWDLNFF